jgi:hypothetical protein
MPVFGFVKRRASSKPTSGRLDLPEFLFLSGYLLVTKVPLPIRPSYEYTDNIVDYESVITKCLEQMDRPLPKACRKTAACRKLGGCPDCMMPGFKLTPRKRKNPMHTVEESIGE